MRSGLLFYERLFMRKILYLSAKIYCLFIHFVSCIVILYICTISAVDCSSGGVNCSDCRGFGYG